MLLPIRSASADGIVSAGSFTNTARPREPTRFAHPTRAITPNQSIGTLHGAREVGDPDRFQYDITVVSGERRHHVRIGERDVDDRLRPLIDRVERDATTEG
jgi:emfourin